MYKACLNQTNVYNISFPETDAVQGKAYANLLATVQSDGYKFMTVVRTTLCTVHI